MFARMEQAQSFPLLHKMPYALECSPELKNNSLMLADEPSENKNKNQQNLHLLNQS